MQCFCDSNASKHQRTPYLPSPVRSELDALPTECTECKEQINKYYEEIVHRKKNISSPKDREGICKGSKWLENFNMGSVAARQLRPFSPNLDQATMGR